MMPTISVTTVTTIVVVVVACGSDQSDRSPWHESLPEITVEVTDSVGIEVAKVEAVPAPEIHFQALLQPDPNHVRPVLAPATGILIRIAAPQDARRGDTLAIVGEGSEQAGREIAVTADYNGVWQPRRQPRQLLWEGEILGHLQERGFWWAAGTVSDDEARFVHRDDPAVVFF